MPKTSPDREDRLIMSPSTAARRKAAKRRRVNPLDAAGITYIDYKDTDLLRKFISDRGKIRSRRVTGLTRQQQRRMAQAVKNAREMALLPPPTR
jgi:small subunit ribosomal protein S18